MFKSVIAGYSRSPFTIAKKGALINVKPDELLSEVIKNLISKTQINKKDIDIQVKENILHVSYENKIKDDAKYSQQQISFGSFENKYKLQNDMDSKNVSATMNNGLLYIKIPKIKNKTTAKIKIT